MNDHNNNSEQIDHSLTIQCRTNLVDKEAEVSVKQRMKHVTLSSKTTYKLILLHLEGFRLLSHFCNVTLYNIRNQDTR